MKLPTTLGGYSKVDWGIVVAKMKGRSHTPTHAYYTTCCVKHVLARHTM